jgi:hypothetical protein
MRAIRIDRGKRLYDEPNSGHNRYRPDIAPVVEIDQGEEIARKLAMGSMARSPRSSTVADFATLDGGAVHPLSWRSNSPTSSPSRRGSVQRMGGPCCVGRPLVLVGMLLK